MKYFEKKYKSNLKDTKDIEEIENLFWKICKGEQDEKTYYAADVSFFKYFSKRDLIKMNEISLLSQQNWNLQNINLFENSLFQFLKNEEKSNISGLTIPWLYFGMIFSTFCWHVEAEKT